MVSAHLGSSRFEPQAPVGAAPSLRCTFWTIREGVALTPKCAIFGWIEHALPGAIDRYLANEYTIRMWGTEPTSSASMGCPVSKIGRTTW